MRRNLTDRQWAFQAVQSASFLVSDREATVTEIAAALLSIQDPPDLEDDEMEQLMDTEGRLLTQLAEARPTITAEAVLKAEREIAGLLRSIEDGDRVEEIELGKATLGDLRWGLPWVD
jgi:hypothetical protein